MRTLPLSSKATESVPVSPELDMMGDVPPETTLRCTTRDNSRQDFSAILVLLIIPSKCVIGAALRLGMGNEFVYQPVSCISSRLSTAKDAFWLKRPIALLHLHIPRTYEQQKRALPCSKGLLKRTAKRQIQVFDENVVENSAFDMQQGNMRTSFTSQEKQTMQLLHLKKKCATSTESYAL